VSSSHCPRPPVASTLRYHLSIEDDLRGVDPRTQDPAHGTKRPRSESTDEDESDGDPKPKRDKLLQELDDLEACSHPEPGLRNGTGNMAVRLTSTLSDGKGVVAATDLECLSKSRKEDGQQTGTDPSSFSSLHMRDKDIRRHPGA
jgi:hypothetical protein